MYLILKNDFISLPALKEFLYIITNVNLLSSRAKLLLVNKYGIILFSLLIMKNGD